MMGMNGGPDPMMGGGQQMMGGGGGGSDPRLRDAIELLQQVLTSEPDDQDSQALAQIVKELYAILATRQKEQTQAMGGNPSVMRALGRAYG